MRGKKKTLLVKGDKRMWQANFYALLAALKQVGFHIGFSQMLQKNTVYVVNAARERLKIGKQIFDVMHNGMIVT
jgi:hypothetical protein